MQNADTRNAYSFTFSPSRPQIPKTAELSTTCFQNHNSNPIAFKPTPPHQSHYFQRCLHESEHTNRNLTFKPVIHELPGQLYPGDRGKVGRSREEIREKLIQDGNRAVRERMRIRVQRDEREVGEFSFQPRISEFVLTEERDTGVFDRLFKQAEQLNEKKLQAQKQKKEQQQKQIQRLLTHKLHPNKPQILNTEKHNLTPLYTRISQILQSRQQLQKQLQTQHTLQNNITFQPTISQNSSQLALKKMEREQLKTGVVDRLMEEFVSRTHRKEREAQKWREEEERECTFNPEVNADVGDASRDYGGLWRTRECSRIQEEEDMYPFVPKIDRLSQLIVQHTRGDEDQETKINRLSRQPLEQRSAKIQKLKQQIYSQFTFKPRITHFSTEISPQAKRHICEAPPPQTFSFQPQINPTSRLIRPQSAEQSRLRTKKRQLQYQLQSEYEQLKQCSFRPRVNNRRHLGQRPLGDVEGVAKFMEARERARKMGEDLRERERRVFGADRRDSVRNE